MNERKGFINRIYRKKDIEKVKQKIKQFGVSKKFDEEYFLNFRLYTTILVFFVSFIFLSNGALLSPIIAVIWYILVGYLMIDLPLKKREQKLDNEAFITIKETKTIINGYM